MKFDIFFSSLIRLFLLFSLLISPTLNSLSQSGQSDKSDIQGSPTIEPKIENGDFSKLELYEYIEPMFIKNFVENLNKLGATRYRIKDYIQVPYVDDKSTGIKLAGIVQLAETKYEYKAIEIEDTFDVAAALNRESKEGFNLRQIITYQSSIESHLQGDNSITQSLNVLISSPQIHNIILLERETGTTVVPREFQLLKAGFGIRKNPSEKMKLLIEEAAKQNFFPIGNYLSFGFAGPAPDDTPWKLVDHYHGVIVEKSEEKQDIQLQFVRAALRGTFKDRINELAQDGFRLGDAQFTQGFMYKNQETAAAPTIYQWINADSKKFADTLQKLSNEGAKLHGASLGMLTKTDLIFERTAANKNHYQYQTVKMTSDTPQTVLIAKTVIPPDEPIRKFRRVIKQGYTFANLLYAADEVIAVFERQQSKNN